MSDSFKHLVVLVCRSVPLIVARAGSDFTMPACTKMHTVLALVYAEVVCRRTDTWQDGLLVSSCEGTVPEV